jgi:DNA-binding MarR family transcriptional regulator
VTIDPDEVHDDILAMPELQLSYEIRETSRLLLDLLKRRITAHRVTLTQYFVMRQLWDEDGISQATLSARLATTQAASVPMIDALELRGLVQRVRDGADRRITRIFLTPEGRALRITLLGYARAISRQATATFTPAEIDGLRSSLACFRANLAAIDDAAETG